MIRILIADDHSIVRQGLKQIIAECPGMVVGGEVASLIAGGLRSLVTVVGPARETPCTAGANTDDAMYLHLP